MQHSPATAYFLSQIFSNLLQEGVELVYKQSIYSATCLTYARVDEKPGVSRHHSINNFFIAFFVSDVVTPCWKRNRNCVGGMRWDALS